MESIINLSPRKAALVAGLSILIMAIAAAFSAGYVNGSLIVAGDAATTAANIKASEVLFRLGLFGWLLILICDVLAAWGLYVFLIPVNQSLSLLTAWLRLVYAAVLGIAIASLVLVLVLATGADYLTAFGLEQLNAQVLLFVNGFNEIWSLGLVVFGVHLLTLGYLTFKSGFIPKIWGILILLAAIGYIVVHLGNLIIPDFESAKSILEMIFMLPMIAGELGLGIWLIVKGGK